MVSLRSIILIKPKLNDFLLDLRRSLAHKGFAKILDISTGMPAVFANPYASRFQHISSQKIAQLRLKLVGFLQFSIFNFQYSIYISLHYSIYITITACLLHEL